GGTPPGPPVSAFYFMEMNTRLQVEHPVTELITGLDLVEWQLRVAAGEELPYGQRDITLTGHAVEARICAEDPARGFLPSGGTVLALHEPQGDGVRTDSGLSQGSEVGSLYDPMLSKVIAYGPDRASALRKLRAALADTVTLGVPTNAGFLRRLLAHPDVVSGDLDTGLVERDADSLVDASVPDEVYATAALLRQASLEPAAATWTDPFGAASGWRLGGTPAWTVHHVRVPGHDPRPVRLRGTAPDFELLLGPADAAGDSAGDRAGATAAPARSRLVAVGHARVTVELDGVTHTFSRADAPDGVWLGRDGHAWHLQDHDPVEAALTGAAHSGADTLAAPMPGTVTVVKVAVGDEVDAGQSLLVVEAMKMEHVISAPHAGTVSEIDVTPGSTVAMDQVLAVVTPHTAQDEEVPS
ncbi:biotin/lipoyl-containing protein, partial [Streptomyces sp. E11-3]|uniref:biotin/lipoyl-containing protein n=1 Tax=Streptomyces sp. E11-3 TaxID=3110112 RepID=UPI003980A79B